MTREERERGRGDNKAQRVANQGCRVRANTDACLQNLFITTLFFFLLLYFPNNM